MQDAHVPKTPVFKNSLLEIILCSFKKIKCQNKFYFIYCVLSSYMWELSDYIQTKLRLTVYYQSDTLALTLLPHKSKFFIL